MSSVVNKISVGLILLVVLIIGFVHAEDIIVSLPDTGIDIAPASNTVLVGDMTVLENAQKWVKNEITISIIKPDNDNTDYSTLNFHNPDSGATYTQSKPAEREDTVFNSSVTDNKETMTVTEITLIDTYYIRPEYQKTQWAVAYDDTTNGLSTIIRGNTE